MPLFQVPSSSLVDVFPGVSDSTKGDTQHKDQNMFFQCCLEEDPLFAHQVQSLERMVRVRDRLAVGMEVTPVLLRLLVMLLPLRTMTLAGLLLSTRCPRLVLESMIRTVRCPSVLLVLEAVSLELRRLVLESMIRTIRCPSVLMLLEAVSLELRRWPRHRLLVTGACLRNLSLIFLRILQRQQVLDSVVFLRLIFRR